MSSYLITGCSRGLGLAFVRQLSLQDSSSAKLVIATTRSEKAPAALQSIIDTAPDRIKHVSLDVTSTSSIADSVSTVESILGNLGLDILVNNAGTLPPTFARTSGTSSTDLLMTFATNVVAVHEVTQAYLPLLRKGTAKKLINITSTMGSVGMTTAYSGFYKSMPTAAYNVSKGALNSLNAQYAVDLEDEGFTVLAISPGHLQTDLGGSTAPLTADIGAKATLDIIQDATAKDNGRFRNIFVEGDDIHNGKDPIW